MPAGPCANQSCPPGQWPGPDVVPIFVSRADEPPKKQFKMAKQALQSTILKNLSRNEMLSNNHTEEVLSGRC